MAAIKKWVQSNAQGFESWYFVLPILFSDLAQSVLQVLMFSKELDWVCFSRANSIVYELFLVCLHQTVDLNDITTW